MTALSDISTDWEELDFTSPFIVIKKVSEIAKFLGIDDPSLLFEADEEIALRYIPVDGKEVPVPKSEKAGEDDRPVAKLSFIRKSTNEPVLDIYLYKDGRALECPYLRGMKPITFRKDHVPQLSLLRSIESAVAQILGDDHVGPVLEIGQYHIVVNTREGWLMFPYFIDEEGNVIIENAPKRVMNTFIPEDEDVEKALYCAILDMYLRDDRVSQEWKDRVEGEHAALSEEESRGALTEGEAGRGI